MTDLLPVPEWDLDQTANTFHKGTFAQDYSGIQIQKTKEDLDRYRQLISQTKPDIVIETGTREGGSALWFQGLGLEVVSIDPAPQFLRKGDGSPMFQYALSGVEWLRGSSLSDWVYEMVLKRIRGKRVMVSLDSDHHSHHVQAELSRYSPLVSQGCYMVVEDSCFDMFSRAGRLSEGNIGGNKISTVGGPLDAIERTHPVWGKHYDRDTELEAMYPISHSPVGWWRRND